MYFIGTIEFIITKVESHDPEDTAEAILMALHEVPRPVIAAAASYVLQCLQQMPSSNLPAGELDRRFKKALCIWSHAFTMRSQR